jgi:hypothetical protein
MGFSHVHGSNERAAVKAADAGFVERAWAFLWGGMVISWSRKGAVRLGSGEWVLATGNCRCGRGFIG